MQQLPRQDFRPGASATVSSEETHDGRRLRIVLAWNGGGVVDTAASRELATVLTERTDGRHLVCVTIEAAGPHFSAGTSIPERAGGTARPLLELLDRAVSAVLHLDLPVLVAVRGSCLGGGLELALASHRVFAAPDARFGLPEISHGMFAPAGSALLPERVSRGLAEQMLLTGCVLGANEALAAGLADEISADPETAALRWFETRLLGKSAMALRFATRAARASMVRRVNTALLQMETLFLEEMTKTRDAAEGVASFVEDRPPRWSDG